jgi:hypothetical protein
MALPLAICAFTLTTLIANAAPAGIEPVPIPAPGSGNPIVQNPAPSAPANVTVNITPPSPDPKATVGMMDFLVANTEFDHASVPVNMASAMLKGPNIFTNTPWNLINVDTAAKLRGVARLVALSLFLLGIVYVGVQLAFGNLMGTTSMQQLLPIMVVGFLIAMFSDSIAIHSVDICNALSAQFGDPSLMTFSADSLTMPPQPQIPGVTQPEGPPGIIGVPATFFSSMLTSLIYAIVLLILEVKMIVRDGVLILTTTVMPISGVLFAFSVTRSYGVLLFRSFFGWLFGQPIVVICLSIASSVLTFFNGVDSGATVLVKLAVLFMAIKAVTIFAPMGLGAGSMFGLAGLMFLFRRAQQGVNSFRTTGGAVASGVTHNPIQQMGSYNGTGIGSAATNRPYRPAYGAA